MVSNNIYGIISHWFSPNFRSKLTKSHLNECITTFSTCFPRNTSHSISANKAPKPQEFNNWAVTWVLNWCWKNCDAFVELEMNCFVFTHQSGLLKSSLGKPFKRKSNSKRVCEKMKNELDQSCQKTNVHHWKQRGNEKEVSGHSEGHAYSWCETSFPVHDWHMFCALSISRRGTKNQGSVLNTLYFLFLPIVAAWFKWIDMSDIEGSCNATYHS